MSICDWFKKKQTVSEFVVRVEASSDLARTSKPDTVESVLNQFIALGHDKPEVVIKGAVRHDGSGHYTATIDGVEVYRVSHGANLGLFRSVDDAEEGVVEHLKCKLARITVEEIEITY